MFEQRPNPRPPAALRTSYYHHYHHPTCTYMHPPTHTHRYIYIWITHACSNNLDVLITFH